MKSDSMNVNIVVLLYCCVTLLCMATVRKCDDYQHCSFVFCCFMLFCMAAHNELWIAYIAILLHQCFSLFKILLFKYKSIISKIYLKVLIMQNCTFQLYTVYYIIITDALTYLFEFSSFLSKLLAV